MEATARGFLQQNTKSHPSFHDNLGLLRPKVPAYPQGPEKPQWLGHCTRSSQRSWMWPWAQVCSQVIHELANTWALGQRVSMVSGGVGEGPGGAQGGSETTACMPRLETSKQATETGRATEQACQGGRNTQLSHIAYLCRALPGQGGTLFPHTHPFDYLCWSPLAD